MLTFNEQLTYATRRVNEWLVSEEGKAFCQRLPEEMRELFSYRDGGCRRTFFLGKEGFVQDYYPVTQPSRKGEDYTKVHDVLPILEALMEEGECRTPAEAEQVLWEKIGVMGKPGST